MKTSAASTLKRKKCRNETAAEIVGGMGERGDMPSVLAYLLNEPDQLTQ